MREESHLDDMRSAIRGDFERLAERRGAQELMSLEDEAPEHDVPESTAQPVSEPEPMPQPTSLHEPETELQPAAEDERVSWLDRLLGR